MKDRVVSKGIVVNPQRMGGVPCVQGTRIPAETVAGMQDECDPMDPDAIIDDFPFLTYADLVNAKLWARRGSPA